MIGNEKKALVDYWVREGIITDQKLIDAFMQIQREEFVLEECREQAYSDTPLPIISGQTISQPTTVMILLQALNLGKSDIVLEIGAGSGYNAAIMSRLCKKVYTTEIISSVAELAKHNLAKAGITNVEVIESDGSLGLRGQSPYDRIIITAACPTIPGPLINQLKDEGIIIAPVGAEAVQRVVKVVKKGGTIRVKDMGEFVFVPLRGKYGFSGK